MQPPSNVPTPQPQQYSQNDGQLQSPQQFMQPPVPQPDERGYQNPDTTRAS